jgi:serine/threonine-protein kinase
MRTVERGEHDLTGMTIDERYEVQAVLGRGAMGIVYRGRHVVLGHDIALKVLDAAHASEPGAVERLRREARAASAIGHRGIVHVLDMGSLANGSLYLVMELHRGESLRRILAREGRLHPDRAIRVAKEICDAMEAAHAHRILHRDLKPENLLVDADDAVTVIDFGIAKLVDATVMLTEASQILGTPLYMSPEQWHGSDVDARADVYSLGAVLYEMLTGRPPFLAETLTAIIAAHLTETPAPPHARVHEIPVALSELVCACLAKEREGRPQSMRALGNALGELSQRGDELGLAPTLAAIPATAAHPERRPTPATPATPAAVPALPAPAPGHAYGDPIPQERPRRWSVLTVALAPIVLALSGLGVYLALDSLSSSRGSGAPLDTETASGERSRPPRSAPTEASATAMGGAGDDRSDAGAPIQDAAVRDPVVPAAGERRAPRPRPSPMQEGSSTGSTAPTERPSHPDIHDPWR